MYYLRTQAAAGAIKFTIDGKILEEAQKAETKPKSLAKRDPIAHMKEQARLKEEQECVNCGS